jgi:hypothetical protein
MSKGRSVPFGAKGRLDGSTGIGLEFAARQRMFFTFNWESAR